MKRTIFQSLRESSISGLGVVLFSVLLAASTAQAQPCTVVQNGSSFSAVCPTDPDKGYVLDWVNNQWHYASKYYGKTTNFPEQYLYAYALWVYTDRSTGLTYGLTIAGWQYLNLQNDALRLLWQMSQVANTVSSAPMSQQFVNTINNNASTNLALIRSMP